MDVPLEEGHNVQLVMADKDGSPLASSEVREVEWKPYGLRDRVLWLRLVDGRTFGVVWRWTDEVELVTDRFRMAEHLVWIPGDAHVSIWNDEDGEMLAEGEAIVEREQFDQRSPGTLFIDIGTFSIHVDLPGARETILERNKKHT
jgi:hypothetical protein